jgi:hypothetical protein
LIYFHTYLCLQSISPNELVLGDGDGDGDGDEDEDEDENGD